MIEHTTIDGRPAYVAYLKGDMEPANKDDHTYIKVMFDDGDMMFATREPPDEDPASKAIKMRKRIAELKEMLKINTEHLPAGPGGGQFAPKGGGGGAGGGTHQLVQPGEEDKTGFIKDGTFHVGESDKTKIRELLGRNADASEFGKLAVVAAAQDAKDSLPVTTKLPGYGSAEFVENRHFINPDDASKELVGYAAAGKYLMKQAVGFAGGDLKHDHVATIMIGPSASGKSTHAEVLAKNMGMAIVDPDDAKKLFHEYRGGIGANAVHDESDDVMRSVYKQLTHDGANVIIPKVGWKSSSIEKLTNDLKSQNYKVNLVLIDVSERNAYNRAMGRFLDTGRLIGSDYMHVVDSNPPKIYEQLKASGNYADTVNVDNNHARGKHVIREGEKTATGRGLVRP